MTPTRGRQRPAIRRRSPAPWSALALALVLTGAMPGQDEARAQAPRPSGRVPAIYHKSRSFRIPFNVEPADQPKLKEVQLWVSEDSGFTWKTVSRTTPDRPSFTFRAPRDAEYWFAVRTLDNRGQLYPGEDEQVEPSMKVIVDTTPPSLVLEPDGRRGSEAAVRWEVRDEHLDLKSFIVEYQVDGGRDWRQIQVRRPGLIGGERWDAGTAEPLRVRASVADRAGNTTEAAISLGEGTANGSGIASAGDQAEYSAPPPVAPVSTGPTFPPRDDAPLARNGGASAPPGAGDVFASPPPSFFSPGGNSPSSSGAMPAGAGAAPTPAASSPFGPETEVFGNAPGSNPSATAAPAAAPAPATPGAEGASAPGSGQTLLVATPRFPLQYAVEDAGPSGPASVELWVTQDGGRTWYRRGEDPDRTSPFPVDLGGEGTFGLRLVARAASGLGDAPPANGDPPYLWVEVDSTPPLVQLYPPVVGQGANLGRVAILWRASDVHLGNAPVMLSWRPLDSAGSAWQPITEQPIENSGKFLWSVPTNIPPRFHVRVDVVDTAGNRASAETTQGPPVVVDRTRPRSRIIGLDPSAMGNAGTRPLR